MTSASAAPNVVTMALTPDLSAEEQYALVYQGITAVAARCDGAVSEDGVGFNGIDTHFGRRIASVPFEEWTDEIKEEAARIAATYKTQIITYIGVNLNELPVVREANEWDVVRDFSGVEPKDGAVSEKRGGSTNHVARDQARAIERRQAGNKLIAERKAVKTADGKLALSWNSKDPDCFGALLTAVKALPGRSYSSGVNTVDFTPEAVAFIEEFALAADFDLEIAKAEAVVAVEAEKAKPRVTLHPSKKDTVVIDAGGWNPDRVADAQKLPGRWFNRANKTDECDLTPAVLTFAKKWNLVVAADVEAKLNGLQAAKLDEQTQADMLSFASRLADPAELPPAFVAMVEAARVR